jgi:hypothetical protein
MEGDNKKIKNDIVIMEDDNKKKIKNDIEFVWRVFSQDDNVNRIFSTFELALEHFIEEIKLFPDRTLSMLRVRSVRIIDKRLWNSYL